MKYYIVKYSKKNDIMNFFICKANDGREAINTISYEQGYNKSNLAAIALNKFMRENLYKDGKIDGCKDLKYICLNRLTDWRGR